MCILEAIWGLQEPKETGRNNKMKLFKKVLAIAMASALALTLLVGCGSDGKGAFTVVDYLNDSATLDGENVTYKADTALDTNAKNAVTVLEGVGAKDMDALIEAINKEGRDGKTAKALAAAVSGSDTKNVYELAYAETNQKFVTDAGKESAGLYQAGNLYSTKTWISVPSEDFLTSRYGEYGPTVVDETKVESTTYVGTATMSLGGKSYLVAVFRTAPKTTK